MEEEYVAERTLCQLPSCHVFQIPRLANATGHRAADWPKDPVWSGKVKITARGQKASIFLLDSSTSQVFATCHVEEGAVERVTDSGRYFVLKITNAQGKHAFIGIAFNERNDAFDFNVSLEEHKRECEREQLAAKGELVQSQPEITNNFKLEEGQKIKVKIAGKTGGRSRPVSSGGGGKVMLAPPKENHVASGGLLSPPPSSSNIPPVSSSSVSSSSSSSVFGFENFGTALNDTSGNTSNHSDAFGTFSSDPFGSSSNSNAFSNSDPFGGFSSASTSSSTDPFSVSTSSQPTNQSQNVASKPSSSSNPPNLLDF